MYQSQLSPDFCGADVVGDWLMYNVNVLAVPAQASSRAGKQILDCGSHPAYPHAQLQTAWNAGLPSIEGEQQTPSLRVRATPMAPLPARRRMLACVFEHEGTAIMPRSRNYTVLQNKLQLPQLDIEFELWEHTRSPGEAMAAPKLYLELGHVQLVL